MPMNFPTLPAVALLLLTACAPAAAQPTQSQAQQALVARMERPGAREVRVTEVESFTIKDCRAPEKAQGVLCDVAMAVTFTVDGASMRSDEAQPMRFVREAGRWVADPE